jgi:hypothetical protein
MAWDTWKGLAIDQQELRVRNVDLPDDLGDVDRVGRVQAAHKEL